MLLHGKYMKLCLSGVLFDDFEWECWAMKTPFWWYFYLFHGRLNLEQGFMSVGETAFQRFPLYALLLPPSTLFMLLRLLLTCTLTLHLLLLGQYKFFRKFHLGYAFNMQIVPCSNHHLGFFFEYLPFNFFAMLKWII